MNTKRTLTMIISASLLTMSAVPLALAGDPKTATDKTTDHAKTTMQEAPAMSEPASDLERAADSATGAVTDTWIQGKLEASLMADDDLSSFAINTEVEDGVATLTGTVDSDADRDLATQIAMSIKGITDVNNSLVVEPADRISQS